MNIAQELQKNLATFKTIFQPSDDHQLYYKQAPEKWNMLEILCHLYDEERLDFRFRIRWLFDKPEQTPPPFNPLDWVTAHDYANQDFVTIKSKFIREREASIAWLLGLQDAPWEHGYNHPKAGRLTAQFFLDNWLAHDYLHMRQLTRLHFNYLESLSEHELTYAGDW
ncbi:MAG: DinB family protein [bacterium]